MVCFSRGDSGDYLDYSNGGKHPAIVGDGAADEMMSC
jgi:hypothetical protein